MGEESKVSETAPVGLRNLVYRSVQRTGHPLNFHMSVLNNFLVLS